MWPLNPAPRLRRSSIGYRLSILPMVGNVKKLPSPTWLFLAVGVLNNSFLTNIYYVRLMQFCNVLFLDFSFQHGLIFTAQGYALGCVDWTSYSHDFAIYVVPKI